MEAITGLVLIFLSSVGARNIPVHTGQPSEWPLVFDGPSSYKKTPLTVIFPAGETVESVDYVADLGLHLNKHNDELEKVEDHVNNFMDLDNEIIENMDIREPASYKKKKINKLNKNGVVRPVVVIKGRKNQKGNKALLGFRVALDGSECPTGKVRVGSECMPEDKGN